MHCLAGATIAVAGGIRGVFPRFGQLRRGAGFCATDDSGVGRPVHPERTANRIDCAVKRIGRMEAELNLTKIDILKMDVEGAEYRGLADVRAGTERPAQPPIEFHRTGRLTRQRQDAGNLTAPWRLPVIPRSPWHGP